MDSTPITSGLIPRVNTCCCGCSLKTGSILIGTYYLACCLFGIPLIGITLVLIGHYEIRDRFNHEEGNYGLDHSKYTVEKVELGILLAILFLGAFVNFMFIAAAVRGHLLLFIMRVRRCCCGCSLRTGTKLIASFYLIIYIPAFKSVLILGFKTDRRERMFKSDAMDGLGREQKNVAVNIAYGCALGALVFIICMNFMLGIAAVLKKTNLLYIWFVVHILKIIAMSVVLAAVSFSRIPEVYVRAGVTISLSVIIFITIYYLIVVHSFYREIKEERAREYIQRMRMLHQEQQQQQQHQQEQQQRDQLYRQQQTAQQQQYLQQYYQQYAQQPYTQQQYEQQYLDQQQEYYQQQQQQYYQQQQQQQQPAYIPVTVFTVSSYNPLAPTAPPP